VEVILVAAATVAVGVCPEGINDFMAPYAVPALFVAYALTKYAIPPTRPDKVLVKEPGPDPFMVIISFTVGLIFAAQQTPRAVTGPEPSLVMVPPQIAENIVTSVIGEVSTVGSTPSFFLHEIEILAKKMKQKQISLNKYFI